MKMRISKFFKSVRYCLAAVNSAFMNTGVLLLIVGVVVLLTYKEYDEFLTQRFYQLCGFVISTGVIIIFVSIMGYYGAYSKEFYVIAAYLIMLVVILIFEVTMIIVSYGLMNDSTSEIRSTMSQSRQQYINNVEISRIWDIMQNNFECCGVEGRHDWHVNRVPVSCCHIDYGTISPFECTEEKTYQSGCASVLGEWLGYNAYVIAITAVIATSCQVIITIAAGWLAWRCKCEDVELES